MVERIFEDFQGRVLPFDSEAARDFGEIAVSRAQHGRPISTADAQIASIVRSRGGRLATRNGSDFEFCGLEIVDPWAG
jgi:predicted nucleic acid-binding protein